MTLSTNLGMNVPIDGASNDVWGAELVTIFAMFDNLLAGVVKGLTLSAAGSTATFGIASGIASGMLLGSAYTKTTSAWGVGTGQGALDTGAIANNTGYHVWLIQRSDTLVVDVLTSLSASSPTMPANYDRKRRIGWMKTDGSAQWVKFKQLGDEFLWASPVRDLNAVTPANTSAATKTLTVPTGIQVTALTSWEVNYATATQELYISSFDQDDVAAGTGITFAVSASGETNGGQLRIRTNTSGQFRVRASSTGGTYYTNTDGWIDRRGQD